jgi:HD-like signal output (HDOD) protein
LTGPELIIALGGSSLVLGVLFIGGSAIARSRAAAYQQAKALRPNRATRPLRHDRQLVPETSRVPVESKTDESVVDKVTPAPLTEETASATPAKVAIPAETKALEEPVVEARPAMPSKPIPVPAPVVLEDLPVVDDVTDEAQTSRNRVILLVGIKEMPLPGPFWRAYSVSNGAEALGQLEQIRCDLIIVDFYTDPSQVLGIVAKEYPYLPRLVRCNKEQAETIRRTVPDAQDVVLTQCEDQEFFHLLERTTALDLGELAERMQEKLGPVSTLPALPDNYQQIRSIIKDPNGSVRDVGKIVLRDIGLTTKVLQVVNSPLYGLRSPITDVVHAATLLGMRGIRDLTLTVEVFGFFSAKVPLGGITVEDLYNYSVKVAAVAQRIGKVHSDDAYTAALLHQIGRLILMTKLPEKYQDALDLQKKNGGPIRDAQRSAIGIDQDETSAYLLSVWGLPQRVIEAVAFFDAPSLVPHATLDVVDILHVAVALVSEHHGEEVLTLDETHFEMLGVADLIEEWRAQALEICPPPPPPEEEENEEENEDNPSASSE